VIALSILTASQLTHAFTYTIGVGISEQTGQPGIGFDPSSTDPSVNDLLSFEIHQGQHQVIQSTFTDPCTPLAGGFDTGLQSVAVGVTDNLPTFQTTVNSTEPLWFFDAFGTICEQGGVFSVNPNSTETAAAFMANALALGGNTGNISTPDASSSSTSPATSAVSSSSNSGTMTTATGPSSTSRSSSSTSSSGSPTKTPASGAAVGVMMSGGKVAFGAAVVLISGLVYV